MAFAVRFCAGPWIAGHYIHIPWIKGRTRHTQFRSVKHPSKKCHMLQLVYNGLGRGHRTTCSCKGSWEHSPITAYSRVGVLLLRVAVDIAEVARGLHHFKPWFMSTGLERQITRDHWRGQIGCILGLAPWWQWLPAVLCRAPSPQCCPTQGKKVVEVFVLGWW